MLSNPPLSERQQKGQSGSAGTPVVLIVDDDDAIRLLLREALRQNGFTILEACDGGTALEVFRAHKTDVILLDVMMPGQDGFDTCAAIRQDPAGRHTPVLMMTGLDDVDSINRAFEAGATDFVTKPLNYTILIYRVRYMLRAAAIAHELRESETRLEKAQRMAKLGHWEWYPDSGRLLCSPRFEQLFGVTSGSIIKTRDVFMNKVYPEDRQLVEDSITDVLANGGRSHCNYRIISYRGGVRYVHQEAMLSKSGEDGKSCFTGTIQDITARKRAEEQAQQLAYFDNVTGLPNRRLLKQELARSLELAVRRRQHVCVLALDLNGFKRFNDTLGHAIGNKILKEVALRLVNCVMAADFVSIDEYNETHGGVTVARISGDEFVIVLTEIHSAEEAAVVSRRVREKLAEPMNIGGKELVLTCSAGISVFPTDNDSAEGLLANAVTAMNHAKAQGRDRYQFYIASMNARALERLSMESSLRRALQREEFELYFEPKVDLRSRAIAGAEALVRWNHPDLGVVSPCDFVPLAEETGLIVPMGEWAIREACRWAKRWSRLELSRVSVSVNISAAQFQSKGLIDFVWSVLGELNLEADYLQFELTESVLMDDIDKTVRLLKQLETIGIRLWIDDFGTGYSSMSYLQQLPISGLKIDRSFVCDMHGNEDDAAIVAAIIALARSLNLDVVAEGVETRAHLELLAERGCATVQGHYFSAAQPAPAFAAWVKQWRREESSRSS